MTVILFCDSTVCGPPDAPVLHCLLGSLLNTSRHIHNRASFPLWPSHFILSAAISNYPLLFPSRKLDTFWFGGLIFQCHILLPFHTAHGVLQAKIRGGLPSPPPVDHVLSELLTMTRPSWVALHSMTHSFIELHKFLHHDKAMIHEGIGGL